MSDDNEKILLRSEESREGLMEGRLKTLVYVCWKLIDGAITIKDLEIHLNQVEDQLKRDPEQ